MLADPASAAPPAGPRLNLRGKIFLANVSIVALAVVVVGGLAMFLGAQSISRTVENQLSNAASTLEQNLNLYLEPVWKGTAAFAANPGVRDALLEFANARRALPGELAEAGVDAAAVARLDAALRERYQSQLLARLARVRADSRNLALELLYDADPSAVLLQAQLAARLGGADLAEAFAGTQYQRLLDNYGAYFQEAANSVKGVEDLLLVDADGFVVFSFAKGWELGVNLKEGARAKSPAGLAVARAREIPASVGPMDRHHFSDLTAYDKLYDAPVFFIGAPVYSPEGEYDGTVVIVLGTSELDAIVNLRGLYEKAGLGQTGSSYLVGADGRLRTPLRAGLAAGAPTLAYLTREGSAQDTTALAAPGAPEAVRRLFAPGATGGVSNYVGTRGTSVVGAYRPLAVPGLPLGLVIEQDQAEALADVYALLWQVLAAGAAMLALSMLASYWLSNLITAPVEALADAARRLAEGDDRARAPVLTEDEIGDTARQFNAMAEARVAAQRRAESENEKLQDGILSILEATSEASDGNLTARAPVTDGALGNVADALNLMLARVSELIRGGQGSSERTATLADDIRGLAANLAQGARRQAEEVVNTSAAAQEMAAQIESVSANATAAAQASDRARLAAETGGQRVDDVIGRMDRIRQNVQAGARRIRRLGERTSEISGIVSTISQISLQTNMLALNAAIEATRAGEQGRGFSVVADEVRRLAERTAQAAAEIEDLVSGIQQETSDTVAAIEQQTQEVEAESREVADAGIVLSSIRQAALETANLIREIDSASRQQVAAARAIVAAMTEISRIAQEAQGGSERTRGATAELAELAGALREGMQRFRV